MLLDTMDGLIGRYPSLVQEMIDYLILCTVVTVLPVIFIVLNLIYEILIFLEPTHLLFPYAKITMMSNVYCLYIGLMLMNYNALLLRMSRDCTGSVVRLTDRNG